MEIKNIIIETQNLLEESKNLFMKKIKNIMMMYWIL